MFGSACTTFEDRIVIRFFEVRVTVSSVPSVKWERVIKVMCCPPVDRLHSAQRKEGCRFCMDLRLVCKRNQKKFKKERKQVFIASMYQSLE